MDANENKGLLYQLMYFLTVLKGSGDSSRSSSMYAALFSPMPCNKYSV